MEATTRAPRLRFPLSSPRGRAAHPTAGPRLVSVPLAAEEKVMVPLPETSYDQVKVCDAPPASTVPAADGGELATAAAAVPVVTAVGAGSASSRSDAPPGFLQVSASWTRCKPAETLSGDAASESVSAAGASTAMVPLVTGAGASVSPVFDSVAVAETCQ